MIVAAPWRTARGFRSISTITWVRISPARLVSRRQNNDKCIKPRLKLFNFGTARRQLNCSTQLCFTSRTSCRDVRGGYRIDAGGAIDFLFIVSKSPALPCFALGCATLRPQAESPTWAMTCGIRASSPNRRVMARPPVAGAAGVLTMVRGPRFPCSGERSALSAQDGLGCGEASDGHAIR
jgi:hypothetical protein